MVTVISFTADPLTVDSRWKVSSVGSRNFMDALDIKKFLPPARDRITNIFYPTGSLVVVPVPVGSTLIINLVLLKAGQKIFLFYKTF